MKRFLYVGLCALLISPLMHAEEEQSPVGLNTKQKRADACIISGYSLLGLSVLVFIAADRARAGKYRNLVREYHSSNSLLPSEPDQKSKKSKKKRESPYWLTLMTVVQYGSALLGVYGSYSAGIGTEAKYNTLRDMFI